MPCACIDIVTIIILKNNNIGMTIKAILLVANSKSIQKLVIPI